MSITAKELAEKIVSVIISDLDDRCGIMDAVEISIRREMREEMIELVLDVLPTEEYFAERT